MDALDIGEAVELGKGRGVIDGIHTVAMPAASELRYSSTSLTIPPAPALRMPPNSTINRMSTAPVMEAHSVDIPNRLPIIADDDSTCDMMLIKMPMRNSIDPTVSALRPYSRLTISSSVEHPLRRKGPA